MDIEEPVEIENEMNITKAIQILNKLKSKVTLVEADEKEYRLPFLMNIEQQAIETVLSELEKKDEQLDIYKTNNEIMQGELDRIGIDTLKLEKGMSTDDVIEEIKKKEAVINEMSNCINLMSNELVAETGDNNLEFCKMQKCIDNGELDCEDCIKEYFTNKVEREGK